MFAGIRYIEQSFHRACFHPLTVSAQTHFRFLVDSSLGHMPFQFPVSDWCQDLAVTSDVPFFHVTLLPSSNIDF